MATTKKRVRLSREERRADLLAHAQTLFTERGYDEVSIADVAAAASVSPGLVFHYFENKRGLFLAAIADASDSLVQSAEAIAHSDDYTPAGRLAALAKGLDHYLAFIEARADTFRFLHSGGLGGDPDVAEILRHTRERFAQQILDEHVELMRLAGQPTDIPPTLRYLALGWTSLVESVTLLWLDDRAVSRAALSASLAAAAARLFGGEVAGG